MNKIPHPPRGGMLMKGGVLLSHAEAVRLSVASKEEREEIIREYVEFLHEYEDRSNAPDIIRDDTTATRRVVGL